MVERSIIITMLGQNPTCVPTVVNHLSAMRVCVSICSAERLLHLVLMSMVRHFRLLLREGGTGRRQV